MIRQLRLDGCQHDDADLRKCVLPVLCQSPPSGITPEVLHKPSQATIRDGVRGNVALPPTGHHPGKHRSTLLILSRKENNACSIRNKYFESPPAGLCWFTHPLPLLWPAAARATAAPPRPSPCTAFSVKTRGHSVLGGDHEVGA